MFFFPKLLAQKAAMRVADLHAKINRRNINMSDLSIPMALRPSGILMGNVVNDDESSQSVSGGVHTLYERSVKSVYEDVTCLLVQSLKSLLFFDVLNNENVIVSKRDLIHQSVRHYSQKKQFTKFFSSRSKMLIVGEDNFQFSKDVATELNTAENMVTTTSKKPGDESQNCKNVVKNLTHLKKLGAQVFRFVDPTDILTDTNVVKVDENKEMVTYDQIIFYNPTSKAIVDKFITQAKTMIGKNGELLLHFNKKNGGHDWGLEDVAKAHCLSMKHHNLSEIQKSIYIFYK